MSMVTQAHHQLTANATAETLRTLRTQVARIASEAGADEETVDDVRLAVNEAIANVAAHAYGGRGGRVELEFDTVDDEFSVVVRDRGVGVEHPSAADGAGFGLVIIERLTLRTSLISTLGRGTELTMVFQLRGSERSR